MGSGRSDALAALADRQPASLAFGSGHASFAHNRRAFAFRPEDHSVPVLRVVGKDGKIRPDMSVSEDDNVLVRGVEGDKNSIGFFGYAYYAENQARLKALPSLVYQTLMLILVHLSLWVIN